LKTSRCLKGADVEQNVWQYLRQNWLSNTVFENYDAIIDAACDAWQKLTADPNRIKSIGMRDWPHVGQPHDLWLYISLHFVTRNSVTRAARRIV
jgi:hypothetical protein